MLYFKYNKYYFTQICRIMTENAPYVEFGEYIFKLFARVFADKTQIDIAALLSTHQSVVSKWYKGERLPSNETIKKIKEVTGEDISAEVYAAKLTRNRIVHGVDVVNKEPYIEINKKPCTSKSETHKPRYELYALAGRPSEYVEAYNVMQPIIPLLPRYDFTIKINGDSMTPEYQSGDEVACLKVSKGDFVQWGKVYVINTSQGAFIKRLYKGTKGYRCVSDNTKYPEFEIPENEVYSISLVVGLLRVY